MFQEDADTFVHVKGGGTLEARSLHIDADVIDVDISGKIHADFKGVAVGEGAGTNRGGGSYGGRGAKGTVGSNACGYTYGDIYRPMEFGSGGGAATNSSGLGGGRLHFNVRTLIDDGTISANGLTGNSNIGAGSGGSIFIQAESVEGFGDVDVRSQSLTLQKVFILKLAWLKMRFFCEQVLGGSSSHQYGGAGGGGRIGVEWETHTWWFGNFQAFGGSGISSQHGGSGTVYITVCTVLYD